MKNYESMCIKFLSFLNLNYYSIIYFKQSKLNFLYIHSTPNDPANCKFWDVDAMIFYI